MKRSAALGSLALIVALSLASAEPRLPPSPHLFMEDQEVCGECHSYYNGFLEPHGFVIPVHEKCGLCHLKANLGRSHPIGVNPAETALDIEIPEELPLVEDLVSCGTCHNPHADWLSPTPSYPGQEAHFVEIRGEEEIFHYRTYFIRMSDPETGFEPLCTACHKDY